MDYFELSHLLNKNPDASNKKIRNWFRQAAQKQAAEYIYRKGHRAPRFPVPAVKIDFEFVYNLSQDCVALAVITHEAGDAD